MDTTQKEAERISETGRHYSRGKKGIRRKGRENEVNFETRERLLEGIKSRK